MKSISADILVVEMALRLCIIRYHNFSRRCSTKPGGDLNKQKVA